MSSKRRLRRRQCEGKRRFPDVESATLRRRYLQRKNDDGRPMNIYLCKFCGGYHVGHAQDWKKAKVTP